jgi:hypothetical protein
LIAVSTASLDWNKLRCRFGCDPERHPVAGLYFAPKGCWCYADHVQALCLQHSVKGQQNNEMSVIIKRWTPRPKHTSFPFLALARERDLDYGKVLRVAGMIASGVVRPTHMRTDDSLAIVDAAEAEASRRLAIEKPKSSNTV